MRTRLITTLGAIICAMTVHARLDYIDADGVTETGGTPDKARMLPRTRSDGRIDPSLLPPEGSWTLPPMARLYFVDAHAAADGDGSVRSPFRTLTKAAASVPSGAALVLAPGTYSGEIILSPGRALTLTGCGFSTVLGGVTITVQGDSAGTELTLNGLRAMTLTVNGGSTYIRAYNANISTLDGTSASVRILRYDLGTTIGTLLLTPLENTYAGYDTVPYASYLRGGSVSQHLHMVGSRPTVGSETGAFLSDIRTATNAVYAAAVATAGTYADTAVAAEAVLRAAGDNAQGIALEAAVGDLTGRIDGIGAYWEEQVGRLTTGISTVYGAVSELAALETNDVQRLEAADAAIRSAYAVADNLLHTRVAGEIAAASASVLQQVPDIATARASVVLDMARAGIVSDAVARVSGEISGIRTDLNALDTLVRTVKTTVDAHTTALASLNTALSTLSSRVGALETAVNNNTVAIRNTDGRVTALAARVGSLESSDARQDGEITTINGKISTIKDVIHSYHKDAPL